MFQHRPHLFPTADADPSLAPHELSSAVALAELRDALAGWIAEAVESLTGRAHDFEREHGGQIAQSLFAAVGHFRNGPHTTGDNARAFLRAATILDHAAANTQYAANLARRHGDGDPEPYAVEDLCGYIRASYAAAVAAVRQARTALYDGPQVVRAVVTTTRCAGGSRRAACSHGRHEDHHVVAGTGRCEASVELADDEPCDPDSPYDAVLVRDARLGQRKGDHSDTRGVRGCVTHGAALLARTPGGTVYPGPADRDGSSYAIDTYTLAQKIKAGEQ